MKPYKILFLTLFFVIFTFACGDTASVNLLNTISTELDDTNANLVTELPDEMWELFAENREQHINSYKIIAERDPTEHNQQNYEQAIIDMENRKIRQETYYKRHIAADDIDIVGPDTVPDAMYIHARNVILLMTSKHPFLRKPYQDKFYMILAEYTIKDVPELSAEGIAGACYITPVGGTHYGGPILIRPPVIDGLCISQLSADPNEHLRIFVHEFSHALYHIMADQDPTLPRRLRAAHKNAIENKIWDGYITYDAVFREAFYWEYWAVLVEIWFYNVGHRWDVRRGRPFLTTQDFVEHDPLGAELILEWFPEVSFFDIE